MKVLILVGRFNNTSIPIDIAKKVAISPSINITLASFYEKNMEQADLDELPEEIDTIFLNANHRFDFNAYKKLRSTLKSLEFDIFHTHDNSIGSVSRIFTINLDICVVNTEHRNHRSFTLLQKFVNFPTFLRTNYIVSNSKETKDSFYWYERLFACRSKHHVIYNGFDFDDMRYSSGSNVDNGCKTIVTVGRLIPIKNHETILYAFHQVQNEISDVNLVVIGGGEMHNSLSILTEELGISESVRFTGNIPREDVFNILSQSDLFVLASKSEGFCVAVIEAMAHQLPVVVSDIPIFNEVVGDAGFFAQPDKPSQFAEEIIDLLTNSTKNKNLGEDGYQRVQDQFPLNKTAKQYIQVYKNCMEDL